jgi:hypothetical protein
MNVPPKSPFLLAKPANGHVQEFTYLVANLKPVPEGDGTLFDNQNDTNSR